LIDGSSDIICNAHMRVREQRQICQLQKEGQSLMRAAMTQLNLSARVYRRILRLERTIADLQEVKKSSPHIWRRRCTLRSRPKLMMGQIFSRYFRILPA